MSKKSRIQNISTTIITIIVFILVFINAPPKSYAELNNIGPYDSCSLLHITFSESPVCPSGTKAGSYNWKVKIETNNFVGHTVKYVVASSFCTNGNKPGCTDNGQASEKSVWVDAYNPLNISLTRSPTYDNNCGTYQDDITVISVDGNTNCHYGNPNASLNGQPSPGGAGLCLTKTTCQYSNYGTCSGLPSNQSLCTDAPCGQNIAASFPHLQYNSCPTCACHYNCCTINPTPTPTPTPTPAVYTIRGNIFNDLDKNDIIDNGETNYTGGISITSTGGSVTTSNGSYTISNLTAGTYTISYTNLPSGYYTVYPKNGPPPSFLVKVGPGCTVDGTTGANCTNGNINNLNFAISNASPWVQLIDLDGRIDNGFKTTIPASANNQCGAYASIQDSKASNPGIPFSGDTSYDFGQGQASTKNWVVGGAVYPEQFSPDALKTSYTMLKNISNRAGLTVTDLSTITGCNNLNNCTLPANLSNGIYQANGNLTLNSYNFPANKNYIFFIKGDLTINGALITPNTSTTLFSASGNITVSQNVKATADACPAPTSQLQGMFSADKNFIVQGINDCSIGADTMLNIEGVVVVNAARGGGNFTNNRDLCSDNAQYPSVTIKARPDFLFNAPSLLSQQSTYSIEQSN